MEPFYSKMVQKPRALSGIPWLQGLPASQYAMEPKLTEMDVLNEWAIKAQNKHNL